MRNSLPESAVYRLPFAVTVTLILSKYHLHFLSDRFTLHLRHTLHSLLGDACDDDQDNDGITNIWDNCPIISNPHQEHNKLSYDVKGKKKINFHGNIKAKCRSIMDRRFSRFYEFLFFCLLFFSFLLMYGSIITKCTNDPSQSKINNFFSANPVGDSCIDDYDGDKVPDVDDECPHVKHVSKTNFRDYFTIDLFPGHPEPSPEWRVAKMVTIFKLMSFLY